VDESIVKQALISMASEKSVHKDDGTIDEDYRLLTAVYVAIRKRRMGALRRVLAAAQERLNTGRSLPVELQQYFVERLLFACDHAPPSGLGMRKGDDPHNDRMRVVENICEKSFDYRNQADPITPAINTLYSNGKLGVSVEYAQRLYRTRHQAAFFWLANANKDNNPRRCSFYKDQLTGRLKEIAERIL
jgi:hypothetical protein